MSRSTPKPSRALNLVLLCVLMSLLLPKLVLARGGDVDFSGSWEMDYGRSENVQQRLQQLYRGLQRQAERQARAQGGDRRSPVSVGPSNNAVRALVSQAKLADHITASQVLEIDQGRTDVEIQREGNFALTCNFADDDPRPQESDLGSELCGWDSHQLVFVIHLPDSTRINHRLTLAPAGDSLHIATTVKHGGASPFTLNRVYYRFQPMPEDYSCEYTLTRGRVCSRNGS
jgi:hypothetical protein